MISVVSGVGIFLMGTARTGREWNAWHPLRLTLARRGFRKRRRACTPALTAGQSATATLTWNLKNVEDGNYTLKAVADAANVVAESNETNSLRTLTFRVGDDDQKDKSKDEKKK